MDRISFKINGVEHTVGSEVSSDTMLLDYIRDTLKLSGTKYMCREAGCGACIVSVIKAPGASNTSVNASKKDLTMLEIEQSFGSNVCRCTGYRPIMQAFKKFAIDAPSRTKVYDIEDLHICKENGKVCSKSYCEDYDWCVVSKDDVYQEPVVHITLEDGREWYRVKYLSQVFEILNTKGDDSYMLVAGNTAKGAYPIFRYPRILIDISAVSELKEVAIDQNLVIGAGLTISEVIKMFQTQAQQENFGYLKQLCDHLGLVANIPVRNMGTLAGNLMIKHQHREFPSDIFLLLVTVGAEVTILNSKEQRKTITMQEFLNEDMRAQIIINMLLPPLNSDNKVVFRV